MEADIKDKREAMELCNKMIPVMHENELLLLLLALKATGERLEKEGRVRD